MKLYTAQGKKFKIPEYQANDFLNEAKASGIAVEEYLPYEAPDKKYLIPASKATEFEQDAKANNVPVKRVENLAIRERYQRVLEGQKMAQTQLPNNALGKVVAIAENAKEAIKKPVGFAMEALTRSPITTIAAGPINAAIQTAVQKISNPKPQEFPPSSKEADIIRKRTFVDEVTAPIKRLAGNLKLIDASIQSGVFGAAEQVARAAKTVSGSTGEKTSMSGNVLDSVQAAKEKYGGSLESLGDAKNLPVQKALSQGVESAVTSGALAAPAALAGTVVGGPAGTVAGYAAGGGVIQGLAEYDRSFDDFVRIKGTTDGAHEYAQKQAAIQGGGEAVQNLIEAATFKLGKPTSVVAKRGFLQFAGQLLKAAPPEIATETGQQYASAKQAEQAGLIETAPTLKETVKEVAAPTAIATALQGGGINLSRIGERAQPIKSFEELSNVVAEQQTSSAEPATIRTQEQGRAPMLDNKLAEVQPTFTETKQAEGELAGQSVGPGAASVLDPAFKEKIPTSIKNAVVDEERIKRGLPPAAEAAKKEFGQSWDNALARMDANPKAQDDLIFELTQKPRPVNDEENAMLLAKQIELQSEYDGAAYSLEEAEKSGDAVAAKDHQVRLNRLSEELLNLYNVNKSVGTENARGLVTRKMLADENYTLANMMTRARIDNGGEKLAPKQEAEVKQLHAEINSARQAVKVLDPTKLRNDAIQSLRENAGQENFDLAGNDILKLARYHVSKGVQERNALVKAVHADVKQVISDVTEVQIRDAISGYGKFKPLSKDKVSVVLRDLKGQMQQVAKLEDMLQRLQLPKKTGLERRSPSDEERRLMKEVERVKKQLNLQPVDPQKQLKSSLESLKTRLKNQISDMARLFETGQKRPDKAGVALDAEAESLKALRDRVRDVLDAVTVKPGISDEQRSENAKQALEKSINEYERRIAERDFSTMRGTSKTPETQELKVLKDMRDALKEEYSLLKNPPRSPEEAALASFKSRVKNQITVIERRTASGEFEKTPKPELKYDAEALDLNFKLQNAKDKFTAKLLEYRLARRSLPKKIFGNIGDSLNTARAIITSADFSAVLRQGGFISFAHPVRSAKALPDMFRAFASEKAQFRVDNEIKNRPNAPLYRRAKLYLADQTGGLTKMEEAYASRWASKIPGVGASQRAYVTFLNRLRADSFDAMVAGLGKDGDVTLEEAKAIANFVNVATGRGSFGSTEQAAVGLNVAFFAPRYVASRFQLIAGQPFYRGDAKTRKLIAKEYARYLTGIGVIYGLAQLAGADTEWDWRSSDFGKIRVDNTLIDPLSGLSQSTVFTGRTITGKTRRPSGEIVPIRGTNIPYGGDDWSDVAKRFLRTKLSPSFAVATDVLTGTDLVGKPTTTGSVIKKALVPISFQDVYDAIKEQGVSAGVALGLLAAFGASVMTYQENAPTERRQ